uniref:Uncharacterized protein n=1 Tax=Oryza brachyantha TaxID=4533 RepID=J3LWS4_ORYBR
VFRGYPIAHELICSYCLPLFLTFLQIKINQFIKHLFFCFGSFPHCTLQLLDAKFCPSILSNPNAHASFNSESLLISTRAQDRSDKASFGQPFQGTHKVANKHSSVIQEKYNTVQNKTQSISTETNITLPVRMSGWENCHLEPEKVSVVYAGKPPPPPQHIASLQKNLAPSPTHKKQVYKPQARSTQCKLTPSSAH